MNKLWQLSILFCAIVVFGLSVPSGCKDGPTGGGGGVDSLRVTFASPANGAVVKGPTPLVATVTGANGAAKVKFILDAAPVLTDSTSPYEYVWDPTPLPNGSSHTLRLVATDGAGNADTTGFRTYIANYPLLGLTVTSPSNGDAIAPGGKFSGAVSGGAGSSRVDFKVDNIIVETDSVAPFEYAWDAGSFPSGSSHTVQLIASDTAYQTVASTIRTVYARWLPMSAAITTPADSSIFGAAKDITVGVNGGSGGSTVDFRLDGVSVLIDNSAPFAYNWNPTALPNGDVHTFRAIVSDTSGQVDTTATHVYFAKWRLIASGGQSPHPINLRNIYARSTSTALQFRVEFDNDWVRADSVGGIDCAFFMDADQNNSSGRTFVNDQDGIPVSINDIGAEYRMIVGGHGDWIWRYVGANWADSQALQSITISRNSNFFECSVLLSAMNFPPAFDLVVSNVYFEQQTPPRWTYDWVPLSGHITVEVDGKYIEPTGSAPPAPPLFGRSPVVLPDPF